MSYTPPKMDYNKSSSYLTNYGTSVNSMRGVIKPAHNRTIMWVMVITTVVIIIGLIVTTGVIWFFDIGPFGHVQPSDPKFKYPDGKYPASMTNVMSSEAKENIQRNIDALNSA